MSEDNFYVLVVRPREWQEYLKEIGPEMAEKVSRHDPDGCVGIFEGAKVYLQDAKVYLR